MEKEKFLIATNKLYGKDGITAFYCTDESNKGNFTFYFPAAKKFDNREAAAEIIATRKWRDCFIKSTNQL